MVGLVSTSFVYSCGSSGASLGGYNILASGGYFERIFTTLPPHNIIYFRMIFEMIDDWQSPDQLIAQADGRNATSGVISSTYTTNLCGGSHGDGDAIVFVGKIYHSASSVKFQVMSGIKRAPSVASFSFRRFMLIFANKTAGEQEYSCITASSSVTTKPCDCDQGLYKSGGSCVSCDPSCSSCFGPLSSQCYSCSFSSGYSFNGTHCIKCATNCESCFGPGSNQCLTCTGSNYYGWNYTCSSTCSPSSNQVTIGAIKICQGPCISGQFYRWDLTCSTSCNSPLLQRNDSFGLYCDWPCSDSDYLYWNNSCLPVCNSPYNSTLDSGKKRCNLPCNTGQYLYQNKSCLSNCMSPYIKQTSGSIDYCNPPCNFTAGQSLNWTGLCVSSCSSPSYQHDQSGISYCDACQPNYFRYSNDSCYSVCNSPLSSSSISGSTFCNNPCPSSQFIFPNASCNATCNSPYVRLVTTGYLFCSPPCLNSSYYYYANGSCHLQCSNSLLRGTSNSVNTCRTPCKTSEFLHQDGSCDTRCDQIHTKDADTGAKLCVNFCLDPLMYYYPDSGDCNLTCSSPYSATETPYKQCLQGHETKSDEAAGHLADVANVFLEIGGKTIGLGSIFTNSLCGPSAGVLNLAGFLKMLTYMRYLKIDYPTRLDKMLNSVNSTLLSLSFGPSIPSNVQSKFKYTNPPGKFSDYQFHSSFIVNYWQVMSSLSVVLVLIVVLTAVLFLTKKKPKVHQLISRLTLIVKWNFFLMMFCTNFDGIVISTSLEFNTFSANSPQAIGSLIVCLVVNILAFSNFAFVFYIIRDLHKADQKQNLQLPSTTKKNRWREFQIYFKGSQTKSFSQRIFMLPYLMRFYVFYAIIGFLFDYPLLQTSFILILSSTFLLYMIIKKPFVSRLVKFQCLTDECFLLAINSLIFGLAILDHLNLERGTIRSDVGDLVIILNVILNILDNLCLIGYLFLSIKDAIKAIKTQKANGIISCLLIFLAPFEVGGMDLELLPTLTINGVKKNRKKNLANIVEVFQLGSKSDKLGHNGKAEEAKFDSKIDLFSQASLSYVFPDSIRNSEKILSPQSRFIPKSPEPSNSSLCMSRAFLRSRQSNNLATPGSIRNKAFQNSRYFNDNDISLEQDIEDKEKFSAKSHMESGDLNNLSSQIRSLFSNRSSFNSESPERSRTSKLNPPVNFKVRLSRSKIMPVKANLGTELRHFQRPSKI